MYKSRKKNLRQESCKNLTGWDKAIRDAERRIERLKAAVAVFKERRDAGEPFPGEDVQQVEPEAA